jgi:hypothetical protein
MNRLLVFVASVSLACLAISSTCLAGPADWGAVAPHSRLVAGQERASSAAWSASFAPSQMVGGGLLSL